MKSLKIFFFLLFSFQFATAQVIDEIGASIGYSNYLGDLVVPLYTFNQSSFAGSAFCKKQVHSNVALRANLLVGKLKGSDQFYRNVERNASFKGAFLECSFVAEYDLLGQRRYPRGGGQKEVLSPYFFAGVGLMVMSQSIHYGSSDNPDISVIYSPVHPAFPLGMGLRKDFSKKLYLSMEWGMRLTLSDYIDGVKLSGDPSDNDVYFYGGLSVAYRLSDVKN